MMLLSCWKCSCILLHKCGDRCHNITPVESKGWMGFPCRQGVPAHQLSATLWQSPARQRLETITGCYQDKGRGSSSVSYSSDNLKWPLLLIFLAQQWTHSRDRPQLVVVYWMFHIGLGTLFVTVDSYGWKLECLMLTFVSSGGSVLQPFRCT